MSNLMITHGGAIGDNGFLIPALHELRKRYDRIYLYGVQQSVDALKGTLLIDEFFVHPRKFGSEDISDADKRELLKEHMSGIKFDDSLDFRGFIPMFRSGMGGYKWSKERKIENARGVNFFDAASERAGTPAAIGSRPDMNIQDREQVWLDNFRQDFGIDDRFLLAWQFKGSSKNKWYPYFDLVIQKAIMQNYPEVFVLGLGDIEDRFKWKHKYHGGRFLNMGSNVTFREAALLTSICDCLVSPETGIFVFSQAFPEVPKVLLATHTTGEHICCGNETTILTSTAKCAPCYNIEWGNECPQVDGVPACIGKIDPSRVIEAIENIILRRRNERHNIYSRSFCLS